MLWLTPNFIRRFGLKIFNVANYLFIAALFVALYFTFVLSPDDMLHGYLVKILYIHVPCAWLSLAIYTWMGIASIIAICLKSQFYKLISEALWLPGIILTILCLMTGSIWGKPAWGTWWVWDARLTTMAILCLFYLGYWSIFSNELPEKFNSSYVCILGLINIPIVKWSVDWWFTLHQGASIQIFRKNTLASSLWPPLVLWLLVFIFWALLTSIYYYKKRRALYKINMFQTN